MGTSAFAEERYYIVVSGPRTPLSWAVIAIVAFTGTSLWGQGPNPRRTPQAAQALLVPAEPAWSIALDSAPTAGGAIDAEHIYIPLHSERVVALSREDGHTAWSRDIESGTRLVVGAGTVYALASDEVHALDAETGDGRWRIPFDRHLNVALALVGDQLLGAVEPATLVAISVTDGSTRWRHALPSPPVHPVLGDDQRLYVTLADGTVTALSAAGGEVLWQRKLEGALAPPALVADRLIVGSAANELYALDTRSGTVAWHWRVGGDVVGAAGSAQMVFVVALDNLIRAVERSSGNQRWKKSVASRPAHPPQVFGDLVVVTSVAPTVSVYSVSNGTLVGTYAAPAELEGPALVSPAGAGPSGVVMVVVTRDGRVVGLRPKPPAPPPAAAAPAPAPPVDPRGGGPAPGTAPTGRGATPAPPPP